MKRIIVIIGIFLSLTAYGFHQYGLNKIESTATNEDVTVDPNGTGNLSVLANIDVASSSPLLELTDTDTNAMAEMATDNSGNLSLRADPTNVGASSNVLFLVDGSEVARIDTDGELGINQAAPAYKLDIKPAGNDDGIRVRDSSNTKDIVFLGQRTSNGSLELQVGETFSAKISSGASEESYIDTAADFGLGTNIPAYKLDVIDGSTTLARFQSSTSTDAIIRLDNSGSGGDEWRFYSSATASTVLSPGSFGIQNGDTGGMGITIDSGGAVCVSCGSFEADNNAANSLHVRGDADIRLQTTGSSVYHLINTNTSDLAIQADQGNTAADTDIYFYIDGSVVGSFDNSSFTASGINILVDNATSSSATDAGLKAETSSGLISILGYKTTSNTTSPLMHLRSDVGGSDTLVWRVEADGDTVSSTNSYTSDERTKNTIGDISDALSIINQLKPRTYKMNHAPEDGMRFGFVAQEVENVSEVSQLVRQDGVGDGQGGHYKALEYNGFIAINSKAIKEMVELINALEARVATLEAQ